MADLDALVELSQKPNPPDVARILEEDCVRCAYAAASRGETSLRYQVREADLSALQEAIAARGIPVTADRTSVTLDWSKA